MLEIFQRRLSAVIMSWMKLRGSSATVMLLLYCTMMMTRVLTCDANVWGSFCSVLFASHLYCRVRGWMIKGSLCVKLRFVISEVSLGVMVTF